LPFIELFYKPPPIPQFLTRIFTYYIRLAKGFAIGSMAINLQEKMGLPTSLNNIEFG
jgi:hypothetical protein